LNALIPRTKVLACRRLSIKGVLGRTARQHGIASDQIAKATNLLRCTEDYTAMNRTSVEWLGDLAKPKRAMVCAVELASRVYDVEIAAV
jgi:enamine deaminase RidA (YjgF/YER057c/UK114 family)